MKSKNILYKLFNTKFPYLASAVFILSGIAMVYFYDTHWSQGVLWMLPVLGFGVWGWVREQDQKATADEYKELAQSQQEEINKLSK